ncbi:MAG: DUF177 domain-containing protein [Gemmatimonadota bacterium]
MLKVDLGQLGREGSVAVDAAIPADAELWQDTDLTWSGDVEAGFRAMYAGTGEVVARGSVEGTLVQECRRCLKPVETPLKNELTLVFVSDGSDEDGSGYPFAEGSSELDLSEAVREEIVLAVSPYALCVPECQGFCPQCGIDLDESSCDCTVDETDPRWAALMKLKTKS